MRENLYFTDSEHEVIAKIKQETGLNLKGLINRYILATQLPSNFKDTEKSVDKKVSKLVKFTLRGSEVSKLEFLEKSTGLKTKDIFRSLLIRSKTRMRSQGSINSLTANDILERCREFGSRDEILSYLEEISQLVE